MTYPLRVRVSLLDRMHAGKRVTAVVGPLRLPDVETARARLAAFAAAGPVTRIALRRDQTSDTWVHDVESLCAAVTYRDDSPSIAELLVPSPPTAPAMEITLAGQYLRTDHDHGLGEVQLAVLAHQIVAGALAPDDPALLRQISRRADGLATALAATFGSRPARALDTVAAIRDRGRQLREATAPQEQSGIHSAVDADPAHPRTTTVSVMSPETMRRLRSWRDETGAASILTLTMCGLTTALRRAGLAVDEEITVPVDLRRYLPPGTNPLSNFVAGVGLRVDPADPWSLQNDLESAVKSGRPLVSLVRTSTLSTLAGLTRRSESMAASTGQAPVSLLFSGVSSLPQFDTFDWLPSGPSTYVAGVDTAGPHGISIVSVSIHGRTLLCASYNPTAFDGGVVSAALEAFTTDPIALLT